MLYAHTGKIVGHRGCGTEAPEVSDCDYCFSECIVVKATLPLLFGTIRTRSGTRSRRPW